MKKILKFITKNGIFLLLFFCLTLGLTSLVFKNATLDDDLYLWETTIMTEALSMGQWFGDYAVGTHGFLFKLPVALIFLLTGPSLVIATFWNILLACFSLYLFYIILSSFFPKGIYPFLGTFLLFTNFQFILNMPTYMREFPVFLSVLLLIYFLIKKKSYLYISLTLLLILDAKEYVFFMIIPALLIYILFLELRKFDFKCLCLCAKAYIQMFFFPSIFLLLMIFTSLIPLNMYALSIIPGVTKGGVEYQVRHFTTDLATTNRMEDANDIKQEIKEQDSTFEKGYKMVISYFGKILYPRSFSFLSIPKVMFFPAFLSSILLFKKYFSKRREEEYVVLSLIFWSYILIFVFRASFDRYLFPILPVVIFFFLLFLKELVLEKKKFFLVVLITIVFTLLGLLFESDYLLIKLILNLVVIGLYALYLFYYKKYRDLNTIITFLLGCITFSVVGYFFYANGQLRQYILWGNDFQVKEVVSYFEDDEIIMLNDIGWDILPKVYRRDNRYNPEWKWELQEWIPRKENLKMFEKFTTYGIYGKRIQNDINLSKEVDLEKIGLMVSTLDNYPFKYQERLEEYLIADWLSLVETVMLKNKTLYIFRVL
jgi:hypothetical protein